ncbi:MAG: tetratricopeptide repeat protein [Candidatus Riflebacteria bacterium]|nr:tetratricopeptide repeat protein [Candidatus Riflebacteria bacterium]
MRRLYSDAADQEKRDLWARSIGAGAARCLRGEHDKAVSLFRQSVLLATDLGPVDFRLPKSLDCIAAACFRLGRLEEAQLFLNEALKICIKTLGDHHHTVARLLGHRAKVLRAGGQIEEARRLEARRESIRLRRGC